MTPQDPEDCPTFTRRPPPPSRGHGGSAAEDDDGPITDVDDGPPTFSVGPASVRPERAPSDGNTSRMEAAQREALLLAEIAEDPGSDRLEVTLVNAAPPHQRLAARVVTADATHLFVVVEGEPAARRISRVACFEHPVGGGWSTWRLSGADRERWHVTGPMPSAPGKNPGDVSA